MAKHTNPPLTTIDIPKHRMGQLAVQLLQQLLSNQKDFPGHTYIDGSLIVRQSTAPVSKS